MYVRRGTHLISFWYLYKHFIVLWIGPNDLIIIIIINIKYTDIYLYIRTYTWEQKVIQSSCPPCTRLYLSDRILLLPTNLCSLVFLPQITFKRRIFLFVSNKIGKKFGWVDLHPYYFREVCTYTKKNQMIFIILNMLV